MIIFIELFIFIMDAIARSYKDQELMKEKLLSNLGEEFRLKFNTTNFSTILDKGKFTPDVLDNGTIMIPYPVFIQGQVFNMRIEKWTWIPYLDMKQVFNNTGYSITGNINIDGTNTEIAHQVQDLPSLLRAHDLGGLIKSEDNTIQIKWKRTVSFPNNLPPIIS